METKPLLSIALVDDYAPARERLVNCLSAVPGVKVILAEDNGPELIQKCLLPAYKPDILIADYQMQPVDGVTVIDYFNFLFPRVRSICISGYCDTATIEEVFSAGACAFVNKHNLTPALLQEAIHSIVDGNVFISNVYVNEAESAGMITPEAAVALRNMAVQEATQLRLTKREKLFAILNATSLSFKQIADILCVDVRTVETTGYRLSRKAGVTGGRKNLMKSSIQNGWIKLASFAGKRITELE